jgi:predicted HicB family RNase H-like nuclease
MEATATIPSTTPVLNHEERAQTVCRVANETYGKTKDWLVFFREILGVSGLVRRLYPSPEELAAFEKTAEYAEIQRMVKRLRDKPAAQSDGQEVTRVITVRLPASVHEFLKAEAHDRKTSINQLCISKLLQVMDGEEAAVESSDAA